MKRRRLWLTEYRGAFGTPFGSKIEAPSMAAARDCARRRRIGERVLGEACATIDRPASAVLRSRTTPARKLHALAFLGLLALRARVARVEDILDDEAGVLHQWAHYEQSRERGDRTPGIRRVLLKMVRKIERRVPGYLTR